MTTRPSVVIYTAIFGAIRDRLFPPAAQPAGVELVAFVDEPAARRQAGWRLRAPVFRHVDPRRQARQHKLLSHCLFPEAAYTLWVDGCLTPRVDVWTLIERYLVRHDLCAFEHRERGCLYKELEACLRLRKDHPAVMRAQVDRYRREGYPYDHGLVETGALLRRHSEAVRRFNEAWWREVAQGSLRDQLSFNYVAWRLKMDYATFAGDRIRNDYFQWRPHR